MKLQHNLPHTLLSVALPESPSAGAEAVAAPVLTAEAMPYEELRAALRRGESIPSENDTAETVDSAATPEVVAPVVAPAPAASPAPDESANRLSQLQEENKRLNTRVEAAQKAQEAEDSKRAEAFLASLQPAQRSQLQLELAQAQIAQERQSLQSQRTQLIRDNLPGMMDEFAVHVASQLKAPVKQVQAIVRTDEFKQVLQQFENPRDVNLISGVLSAVAATLAHQDAEATAAAAKDEAKANRLAAKADHLSEGGGGNAGAYSPEDTINNMPRAEFEAYKERLKRGERVSL